MNDQISGGPDRDDPQNAMATEESASLALTERKLARRRAKRSHGPDVTDLNLIPIMGLFTAMVLYLLKSYASDPVQIQPTQDTSLPTSISTLSPQDAPSVAISQRSILVNDKVVARIENGRVLPQYKKNNDPAQMYIVPLFQALKEENERQRMFARYNKERNELQFKGLLTIIGDRRIPFRVLTEVLYTAGQAEYGSYKFAVIKQET